MSRLLATRCFDEDTTEPISATSLRLQRAVSLNRCRDERLNACIHSLTVGIDCWKVCTVMPMCVQFNPKPNSQKPSQPKSLASFIGSELMPVCRDFAMNELVTVSTPASGKTQVRPVVRSRCVKFVERNDNRWHR